MTAAAPNAPTREESAGRILAGVGFMVLGMAMVPAIDVLAKLLGPANAAGEVFGLALGDPLPALQISFARFAVQTLAVAPILLALAGWGALRPRRLGLAVVRGILIALATVLFFTGLQRLEVATAIAIFFVEPLILTVLSALVLREPIGWRRILAVLIGLGGALVIIRPNFAAIGWPALLPLAAAFCFAGYLTLTKILAAAERPLTLHLWAGITGSALLGGALLIGAALEAPGAAAGPVDLWTIAPRMPTPAQLALLVALGLVATLTHFFVVLAFARAPASLLAPLQYLEIVSGTALAWLVLGEWPDAVTVIGVAVIIAAGGFVIWRENLRARERGAG